MKLQKFDLYIIPLPIICIAAAVLRGFALLTSFNIETMHFEHKTAFTISAILVAVSVFGFLGYLIFGEGNRPLISRSDNPASYIPAGIVCIALLFMAANNLSVLRGGFPRGIVSGLSLITGIFALLSVLSFFLSVFIERRGSLFKAAFSLSIVLFLALYAALLYFNKQIHPTNSPNRFIDEMAYLGAALFYLYESRIPLGRAKWRGYVAFGLCATLLCVYSSVPALILYFVKGYVISESLIESILTLTLAQAIFMKLLQLKKLIPDEECEAAQTITRLASIREEEIRELHESSYARKTNNMEENVQDAANYTIEIPETKEDVEAEEAPFAETEENDSN